MADTTRFGRAPQFGDQISLAGDTPEAARCGECETMLADALNGELGREDQALFDAHIAGCPPCATMLADARRGLAWLGSLRDARPEPPPDLVDRILARTSGSAPAVPHSQWAGSGPVGAVPQGFFAGTSGGRWAGNANRTAMAGRLAHWRERIGGSLRGTALLQPRLVMTTAMTFFSLSLTFNLAGLHMRAPRASDLTPSSIRRGFYRAGARAVQYYEGLRVVYELESRVHDLEREPDTGSTPESAAPAAPENNTGAPAATQPGQIAPAPREPAQPGSGQPGRARPNAPEPPRTVPRTGTSRRESLRARGRGFARAEAELDPRGEAATTGGVGNPSHPRRRALSAYGSKDRNSGRKAGTAA